MAYKVNFKERQVETTGIESSPVAESLAGLRANEAHYSWKKTSLFLLWKRKKKTVG